MKMYVPEFQAVVFSAGSSSPLQELDSTPKCVLPVGNYPMLYYPLQWLRKNGFEEVIIAVYESTKADIIHALAPHFDPDFRLDFVTFSDELDWGTADVLRDLHLKRKLKTDILAISCDVFTQISVQEIANVFRLHDASLVSVFHRSSLPNTIVPGTKMAKQSDREFYGIDPVTQRLVFSSSEADMSDDLILRRVLLNRYPRIKIQAALNDAHIYLLKHWTLDLLAREHKISSVRGDLVPFLIKKQHRSGKALPMHDSMDPLTAGRQVVATPSTRDSDGIDPDWMEEIVVEDKLEIMARKCSSWNDHRGDMQDAYFGNSIRCYAHLVGKNDLCFRVNSVASFCESNRQAPNWAHHVPRSPDVPKSVTSNVKLGDKAQVSPDCVIGENTVIGEKVSIKKSVIGRNCRIADKAKISNCVLMDEVTIAEGCNIQNTVICNQVEVGEKSEIKDCLIGSHFDVSPNSKLSSETLTDSERLIEY